MVNTKKLMLKGIEKGKEAGIVKTVLRKHTFGSTLPSLKTYPKAAVMNTRSTRGERERPTQVQPTDLFLAF